VYFSFTIIVSFSHILFFLSQDNVATQLKRVGMFNNCVNANLSQSVTLKEFLKICQYLAKTCTKVWWHVFMAHGVLQKSFLGISLLI